MSEQPSVRKGDYAPANYAGRPLIAASDDDIDRIPQVAGPTIERWKAGVIAGGVAPLVAHPSGGREDTLSLGAGTIAALYGALTVPWGLGKLVYSPLYTRIPYLNILGDTTNPDVLAGTLVLVIPVGVALLVAQGLPWSGRFLLGLALLPAVGVLTLTQSRVAFAALIVGLAAMAVRWDWRMARPLGFLAVILAVALLRQGPAYLAALMPTSCGYSGWSARCELWTRALTAIGDVPFSGIGLGAFPQVMPAFYPPLVHSAAQDAPHATICSFRSPWTLGW